MKFLIIFLLIFSALAQDVALPNAKREKTLDVEVIATTFVRACWARPHRFVCGYLHVVFGVVI